MYHIVSKYSISLWYQYYSTVQYYSISILQCIIRAGELASGGLSSSFKDFRCRAKQLHLFDLFIIVI